MDSRNGSSSSVQHEGMTEGKVGEEDFVENPTYGPDVTHGNTISSLMPDITHTFPDENTDMQEGRIGSSISLSFQESEENENDTSGNGFVSQLKVEDTVKHDRTTEQPDEVDGQESNSSDDENSIRSQAEWTDSFPELDLEELEQQVLEQSEKNFTLRLETECLQRYFDRQQMTLVEADDETEQPDNQQLKERSSRRRSRSMRSSSRSTTSSVAHVLTDVQKSDIAQRDLDYLRAQLRQYKEESLQMLHTYQAAVAEAEVRLMEIPKLEMLYFDEVIRSSEKSRSGKVETEALQTFYRHRIKQCESEIDKLCVKNQTMRSTRQRVRSQLHAKDEIGGHLHQVDFEQLKIENAQFSVDIENRNKELSQLKSSAGSTCQILEKHKNQLRILQAESEQITSEIASRKELLNRIKVERKKVESARRKLQKTCSELTEEVEEYKVPDVLELVKQQAMMPNLKASVRTAERKKELAQMQLTQAKRSLRGTRRSSVSQVP